MTPLLRRAAAALAVLSLLLAGCSTGVEDEDGWRKILERDYPCEELLDVARKLPASVDRETVEADLRAEGCDPADLDRPAAS